MNSLTLFRIVGIIQIFYGISDSYENAIKRFCYVKGLDLIEIQKTGLGKPVGFTFTKNKSSVKVIWRYSIERVNPDF